MLGLVGLRRSLVRICFGDSLHVLQMPHVVRAGLTGETQDVWTNTIAA